MSEEIKDKATQESPITTGIGFVTGPHDEGLDLNNLPAPPWTPDNIGQELFDKLAIVSGAGHPGMKQIGLSLDPRTFGHSRAHRIAALMSAKGADLKRLVEEGQRLQEIINERLPPPAGTPRHEGAPPLTSSRTIKRTRTY